MQSNTMINYFESVNLKLGRCVSWLSLAMVVLMFSNVLGRYIFGVNFIWQQELVGFMHAIIFLLASGYTFIDNEHVRVDIFYQKFSQETQSWIMLSGVLLFLFPFIGIIAWYSLGFIVDSWKILESSAEYNGMPGVFILKTSIWIFCLSLFLQGLVIIMRSINQLRGEKA